MALDGRGQPGAVLGPVVAPDDLEGPQPEPVGPELPARADIGSHQVHVLQPPHVGPDPAVPLVVGLHRGPVPGLRHVLRSLVVNPDPVAVRVGELVGRPLARLRLDPAARDARILEPRHPAGERLRRPGSDGHVPEPRGRGSRQLEAVGLVVTVAAQVPRFTLFSNDREPEQRGEVLKRRFRCRRQQLRVPDMRHVAPLLSHAAKIYDPPPAGKTCQARSAGMTAGTTRRQGPPGPTGPGGPPA